MGMTPRQAIAYGRPCFEAEETTARRYYSLRGGLTMFSVGLTANIGLE
jgi:hypothetical protein